MLMASWNLTHAYANPQAESIKPQRAAGRRQGGPMEQVLQLEPGESRQAQIHTAASVEGWGRLYWDEVGKKESLEEEEKKKREIWDNR